jgi:hypothetical protein
MSHYHHRHHRHYFRSSFSSFYKNLRFWMMLSPQNRSLHLDGVFNPPQCAGADSVTASAMAVQVGKARELLMLCRSGGPGGDRCQQRHHRAQ